MAVRRTKQRTLRFLGPATACTQTHTFPNMNERSSAIRKAESRKDYFKAFINRLILQVTASAGRVKETGAYGIDVFGTVDG